MAVDEPFVPTPWQSLRWRLPATMGVLVAITLAVVLVVAYREVRQTLIDAAGNRARAAAEQIGRLLDASSRQSLAQLRAAASHPAVRRYLQDPSSENRAAAQAALAPFSTMLGPRRVVLWRADRVRAIEVLVPAREGIAGPGAVPEGAYPATEGLSPLQPVDKYSLIDSAVAVSDGGDARASNQSRPGYLTMRAPVTINPPGLLGSLVGADALVLIGNRSGDLWVDLGTSFITTGPSIDLSENARQQYRGPDGRWHIGALSAIADTPYAIWVEFPRDVVMAPAALSLRRMVGVAVLFVFVAALAIGVLAIRITRPLAAMTSASEAVAAGDYSRRVGVERRDEIGRLGRAFDAMTARVAKDIAERQRTARVLAENEARTHFALSSARMGIWQLEISTGRLTWSETMAPLFGVDGERVPIAMDQFFELVHPDDRAVMRASMKQLSTNGNDVEIQFRTIWSDGTVKWLGSRAKRLADPEGAARILGVVIDITHQQALEDQFRQAQKMEAIGQLAGGVAHDFNNLLTGILGFASLVLKTLPEDDPRRADVQEIINGGRQAADLTAQLLAFSRKQRVELVLVDLNALIAETSQMLRRLIGEDVELSATLAKDLALIRADAGQLRQVLVNLAVNARDAMPSGGRIAIETANIHLDETYIERHRTVAAGRYVMLIVSDTGSGMSPDVRERIFEPFFTTKERGRGTGLGLATVYGAVTQAGGHVWVYSEPGQGTTFKIYLPAAIGGQPDATTPKAEAAVSGGAETVLLVEDELSVRNFARTILTRAGYRVLEARDASDAEVVYRAHGGPVHVLITDVVLPGSSGPELYRRLTENGPRLAVLYMSGYTEDTVFRSGRLESGAAFMPKPFSAEVLMRKLRDVLDS